MGADNKWGTLSTWHEGKRKYVSVNCTLCGKITDRVRQDSLEKKECPCIRKPAGKPLSVGQRFGKLTVVSRNKTIVDSKNAWWDVVCDCGEAKSLQGSQLRAGCTNNCGCVLKEKRGNGRELHGMASTKEYKTWLGMCRRTATPDASTRKWYFDKGVKVCPEWRASFVRFHADMGDIPEGYSLDRINPAGDYCKDNCRWASLELQSINKGLFCNNTSGKTGVSLNQHGKYMAYIYNKGDRIHLGSYSTYESAIMTRLKAEKKY